jgi:hypothetical protein
MKKWVLPLLVFVLLGLSCTTQTKDFRKKIEAGDYTDAAYDYPWEQVFDAIAFVWRNSEDSLIASMYARCVWDIGRESKMMLCKTKSGWHATALYLSIGIYFEPKEESKTKVMFVYGVFYGGEVGEARTERIIDESSFLLENGEEAYRKYTHVESLRTKKLYRSKG